MKNYLSIILLAFLSNIAHTDAYFDSQLELAEQEGADAQYNLGVSPSKSGSCI